MVDSDGVCHQAVRQGHWKAVRHGADQPWLLFDLQTDSGEQSDLASQNPERVKALSALLDPATSARPEASASAPGTQGSEGKRE
jgi:arylsulfatase A-like enzyme